MQTAGSRECLSGVVEYFGNAVTIRGTPGNYTFSGPLVIVLGIISEHIGRCFSYTRASMAYGYPQPNGSWTGTLGQVQRNKFDFLASFITLTSERVAALDPSTYIILDEMTAVYARPGVEPDVAGFIKPYTAGVWLLVLLAALFVFAAGVIVLRCVGRPAPPR
ncbi:glutamate receptor ionotropic, kainate 5-like [Eriocheir sinensis]|uniref:glutamate receptor ionotropic, kainate 5-like n=1 Tax=Eriocheir sinensis TaxID=95602 RepID=UPI0021CAA162|nr:glutamate receptor ionotropic, kainate 5-like [Eriocheir sinensis]